MTVFRNDDDKDTFLSYISRYLNSEIITNPSGGSYPNFNGAISILAYAVMGNHYHLLLKQEQAGDLPEFMRALHCSYVGYANKSMDRVGPLFQSRYRSKLIDSEPYWLYISKYIHQNPKEIYDKYSSFRHYESPVDKPVWLDTLLVLSSFKSLAEYKRYIEEA